MFGNTSTFGSTAPSFGGGGFTGTPSTNAFGSPQQTGASLFGNTGGFNPTKQTTFGTTFGSPSTSTLFGQQNRLGGNTTMFSNTTGVGIPFAATGQAQGTSVSFTAITGSDTMMKNGVASPINTRHQCITCMKEYEQKSLEELRLEDYQLGRKGSAQPSTIFGNTQAQPTGLFSSITPASNANTAFGQRTPTFGTVAPQQTGGGLFSNLSQPKSTFFPSTTPSTTAFGAPSAGFSFPTSQPQQQSIFGQTNTVTSTGIGTTQGFTFNQPTQQQPIGLGVFGQKTMTTPATSATPFGFAGQTNPAITKATTLFSSTPTFPQQPAFGTPAPATTNLFGTQSKAFSFGQAPVNSAFGAPASSAPFAFSNPVSSAPAFGGGTSLFGAQTTTTPSAGFTSFGAPSLSLPTSNTPFTGFNIGSTGLNPSSTGFSFTGNTCPQPTAFQQAVTPPTGPVPFATTPYKDSPLFYNLITNRNLENMTKPTNPLAQRAVKEASRRRSSTALGSIGPSVSLKQMTFPVSKTPSYNRQTTLFDGFEEDDNGPAIDILSPKTSVKKLSLKTIRGIHRISLPATHSLSLNDNPPPGSVSLSESYEGSPITSTQQKENETLPKDVEGDDVEQHDEVFQSNGSTEDVNNVEGEPEEDIGIEGIRRFPLEPTELVLSPRNGTKQLQIHELDVNMYTPHSQDEWEKLIAGKSLNKSGVISTISGYYTQPTLSELDLYTDDDGKCFIRGFCVGRYNYGQVRFLEVVNVAGLNLDEIVKFRHKEIVVYPEGTSPPVGQGLNVRAQVRLERIWPTNKETSEPIINPVTVRTMKYENLLRRSCERMDATFISYDDEHGIWVFIVKHFSKYSCVPEEDEEEEGLSPPAPKMPSKGLGGLSTTQLKSLVPKITESCLYSDFHEELPPIVLSKANNSRLERMDCFIPVTIIEDSCLDDSIMQSRNILGSIFFPDDNMSNESFKERKIGRFDDLYKDADGFDSDSEQRGAHGDIDTMDSESTASAIESYSQYDHLDQNRLIRLGDPIVPLTVSQLRIWQYHQRDEILRKSVKNPLNMFRRLCTDSSSIAIPPRQTRVSFGPKGHFFRILNNVTMSSLVQFKGVVAMMRLDSQIKQMDSRVMREYRNILSEQLTLYLENSQLFEDSFSVTSSGMITSHIETIYKIRQQTTPSVGPHNLKSLKEELEVWKLIDILWSNPNEVPGMKTQYNEMNQRARLSKWLISNGSMLFSKLFVPEDNSVKGLLLKGMKLEASRQAMREKNYTLALCLGQNNPFTHYQCRYQLNYWEREEVFPFIEPALLELYGLSAGYPIWSGVDFGHMSTAEWLQHFATFVWYLSPAHLGIEGIVSFYQTKIVDTYSEVSDDFAAPSANAASSSMANLCIHLLKMYSCVGYPIQKLLSPKTLTTDVFDYKVSWFLLNTFLVLGVQIESGLVESITSSFAQELEMLGMWEWAIFVLKFLPPSEPRRISIKRLLEKSLALVYRTLIQGEIDNKINFLERIGINLKDVEEAKV